MKERKKMIRWIKKNQKQLIIAGISVGALILIILGIRNRAAIKAVWAALRESLKQPVVRTAKDAVKVVTEIPTVPASEVVTAVASSSEGIPYEVRQHIRNLPDGWHASPEKIAEALKHSIILVDGQTWVDSYLKGGAAA